MDCKDFVLAKLLVEQQKSFSNIDFHPMPNLKHLCIDSIHPFSIGMDSLISKISRNLDTLSISLVEHDKASQLEMLIDSMQSLKNLKVSFLKTSITLESFETICSVIPSLCKVKDLEFLLVENLLMVDEDVFEKACLNVIPANSPINIVFENCKLGTKKLLELIKEKNLNMTFTSCIHHVEELDYPPVEYESKFDAGEKDIDTVISNRMKFKNFVQQQDIKCHECNMIIKRHQYESHFKSHHVFSDYSSYHSHSNVLQDYDLCCPSCLEVVKRSEFYTHVENQCSKAVVKIWNYSLRVFRYERMPYDKADFNHKH